MLIVGTRLSSLQVRRKQAFPSPSISIPLPSSSPFSLFLSPSLSFLIMTLKDLRCLISTATLVLTVAAVFIDPSYALQYTVGDTVWAIPPNPDFYSNWSSSQFFVVGDTLLFDFESDYYDVIQVSSRDYETCSSSNPFQAFMKGPVVVSLIEKGVFYFICSIGNYCDIGQKLAVIVHQQNTSIVPTPAPASAPAPSLEPVSPSLAPLWSPQPSAGTENGSQPPAASSEMAPSPAAGNPSSSAPPSIRRSRVGFCASVNLLSFGVVLAVFFKFV